MLPDDDRPRPPPPPKPEPKPAPPKRKPLWPWLLGGAVVVGFVTVVLCIIFLPSADVWTDDAYVTVHYTTVAPRIAGQVTQVWADDNQLVQSGQVLAVLDDRDQQNSVAQAQAMLDRDRAQVADIGANIIRQPALIAESLAQLESARARLSFAEADAHRYTNLAATGAGTLQQHQQSDATLRQERASVQEADARLQAARDQLLALRAQHEAAVSTAKSDEAALAQAKLNLSYTRIVAPLDGMVGERGVQVGNWVTPGSALLAVVPLGAVYIEANYRELALRHVERGQAVTIHVDAYDIDLDGLVDSVPPASGTAFAPVKPENATGNFTKIVQRLPVKIVLRPGQDLARLLRVGFSVETTIHTGLANVVGAQQGAPQPVTAH